MSLRVVITNLIFLYAVSSYGQFMVGAESPDLGEPMCRFDHDYKVLRTLSEFETRLNRIEEELKGGSKKTQCENGWVTFNGKCYLFNDRVELTWDEAIGFCSNDAAQLVTIRNQEEYFFVQDYTRRLFKGGSNKGKWMWIGCSDKSKDGFYSWYTDGSLVRSGYSNWVSGEGDTGSNSGQDCGVLWGDDNFNWHDYYCDHKFYFICQKNAY